jgi:hypothetical protein
MCRKIIFVFASLILNSCNNYENTDLYKVHVGETIEIYYSTNSCCYYCLSNEKELKHTKLVERKTIDSGAKDCVGCNYTAAFVLKAESIGVDTVKLKLLDATTGCNNNDIETERHIVEIK